MHAVAEISVIPPSLSDKKNIQKFALDAANGTKIKTFCHKLLKFDLRLGRFFNWLFFIVKVNKPIIGVDFLTY